MMVYLFIWSVVAATPAGMHNAWVNSGQFASVGVCNDAAKQLQLEKFRCISSNGASRP